MFNPDRPFVFGKEFFNLHQERLLKFANSWIGRYILKINGDKSSVGKHKIRRIEPNSIWWTAGRYRKVEFRTHNKYSKRLFYAFYPLWWLMHEWDILFANNLIKIDFKPAYNWNLGFDTLTVYPDANPETNSVDGVVLVQDASSWANARAGTGSLYAQDSETSNHFCRSLKNSAVNWHISRGVLLFYTADLPTSPTISSAILSVKDTSADLRNADGDTVDIVSSNPASNTALATGDFGSFGATSFASIAFSAWNSSGTYNDFTIDATGIATISDSAVTKFGARSRRDIANSEPTGDNFMQAVYADTAGTTSDPKLVITYTEAAPSGTNSRMTLLGVGI